MIRAVQRRVSEALDGLAMMINRHERYCAHFESAEGKAILRDLMRKYRVLETTHVPGDPHSTAYNEGQRSVILSILRYVNKDTTSLIKQIEETASHEHD